MLDFASGWAGELIKAYGLVALQFLFGCAVFSGLELLSSQACNPGPRWWRSPSARVEAFYAACNPFFGSILRFVPILLALLVLSIFMTPGEIGFFFAAGKAPLASLPLAAQCLVFLVGVDFYFYWTHRLLHKRPLWRLHIVHHAAREVNWTTAYRVHPLSAMLEAAFPITILIMAGASLAAAAIVVQFMTLWSFVVHANLNWTFGPLRYVLASPVFHRWHHDLAGQGKNYGAVLTIWDAMFGTFFLPEARLPAHYGVDEAFPERFLGQLAYPFRPQDRGTFAPALPPSRG